MQKQRSNAWRKNTNKMQKYRWFIVNSRCWLLTTVSTCFGHLYAHHQEKRPRSRFAHDVRSQEHKEEQCSPKRHDIFHYIIQSKPGVFPPHFSLSALRFPSEVGQITPSLTAVAFPLAKIFQLLLSWQKNWQLSEYLRGRWPVFNFRQT